MTKNLYLICGVIAVFVISALMFYHHQNQYEGFEVEVPADLNKAPIASPNLAIPTSSQRPTGVPGPSAAPRKAIATPKELRNLDEDLMIWLDAASQLEREHPSDLSIAQKQQRVLYQARVRSIREQLGSGKIEDTSEQVNREVLELRDQNAVWTKPVTSLATVSKFGSDKNPDSFLDPTSYKEFRSLFEAGLNELKGHSLADPLQTVRLQQLQVMEQELKALDKRPQVPIKFGPARLYLQQMLQPSQPLPSLLSLDLPASRSRSHETDPKNIIPALKDIQWSLTIRYNPGEQELMKSISEMIRHFESGDASPEDVIRAREEIVNLQNRHAPAPYSADTDQSLSYNPAALIKRATTLCKQIHEAFPEHGNAEALGCPKKRHGSIDRFEAETIINTVCDRLRTSVPTVSPEQFNCPPPGRKHNV
jgi:hypothetical protein